MSICQRGTIVRISIDVEYPDGSRKKLELETPGDVAMIAFDAGAIPVDDHERFDVSATDWSQNPATMVYLKGSDIQILGGGGIPYCTHNGCATRTPP